MIINRDNRKNIDYRHLITSIDLVDLTKFLISLSTEEWVPTCYWDNMDILNEPIYHGKIWWGIYSYLVKKEYILIENPYWGDSMGFGNHPNQYYEYTSYYNPLEQSLYNPILMRLGEDKQLVENPLNYWIRKKVITPLQRLPPHKILSKSV